MLILHSYNTMKFFKFNNFKDILKHIDSLSWKCEIDSYEIYCIAKKEFKNIAINASKNKKYFRLIGQSGSGKTTQLLPAINEYCYKNNIKPVHFAVRNFAIFHPQYDKLLEKYGNSEIREITNGFALKCLLICLVFAIQNNFDILLEVTLLTKKFEKFLLKILKNSDFSRKYYAIAINKQLSNHLINKRKLQKNTIESGRKVNTKSADFFYKNLFSSLNFLTMFDKSSNIIIWNAFNLYPVYDSVLKNCRSIFIKNSKIVSYCFKDVSKLSKAKVNYLTLR